MNPFIIPEYPDLFQDVPFSFDRNYKTRIDSQIKKGQPSSEMLSADPIRINIPGAPISAAYYAPDGTPLQAPSDGPVLMPDQTPADGRYFTEIGSAHIEAFLKKGTRDYLYVFPDGARTRNEGRDLAPLPSFLRWSWYYYTAASVLCLEDPMYYTYSDLKLGWFYGTAEEDYTEYCAMLVRHIAGLLHIPLTHIILYGPSGGGHVAVSMSAFLPGSMAVSVNGQYDITRHFYYLEGHFTGITGISGDNPGGLARNRTAEIIREHSENRYLLICNMLSEQDFDNQLQQLCGKLGVVPEYGLKTIGNLTVWLIDAPGVPEPHNSWENEIQFRMIDILLANLINGCTAQDCRQYCYLITRFWKERYESLAKIRNLETALKSRPEAVPSRLSGLFRRIAVKLKTLAKTSEKPKR